MRLDIFEQVAPLCPRCLHGGGRRSAVHLGDRSEMRHGQLWHGTLVCSEPSCWLEFPVIDGVPLLVADPRGYIEGARWQILAREPLPPALAGAVGDALGPDGEYGVTRHHLSLYAGSHFDDWAGGEAAGIEGLMRAGLDLAGGAPEGAALDLGGAVGRGGWTLTVAGAAPVVVGDMNFAMLRLGQELAATGRTVYDRRRAGVVFDRVEVELPEAHRAAPLDFWAMDATALPLATDSFGLVAGINLIDCVAGPTQTVVEIGRVVRRGGTALIATPYDWSLGATEMAQWLGGHSQRTEWQGAPEPVLRATLERAGLQLAGEAHDLPWRLRLHERSEMHYSLHMVAARKR